jgi:hypothetical protein
VSTSARIQLRRDTAANWTSANPVLAQGEPGLETDTGYFKLGDGVSAWSALAYSSGSPSVETATQLAWQANAFYKANMLATQGGILYQRNADGTSAGNWTSDASNWTALTAAGVELGSATIASAYGIASTSMAAVPGLSSTVTVGSRPILVQFVGYLEIVSGSFSGSVALYEDGVQVAISGANAYLSGSFATAPVPLLARRSPSAGSHTYSIQAQASATSGMYLTGGSLLEITQI